MLNTLDVDFHGKRHTDFDLARILKAKAQGFEKPITAYPVSYTHLTLPTNREV